MDLEFDTNFTIMPTHCNYLSPLVFGGALFSKMDLCAAVCSTRLLRHSPTKCTSAVTHKADVTFHEPSYLGEIIYLHAKVVELRQKAIKIHVRVERERRLEEGRDFIAECDFVFVSMKDGAYFKHGLEMPDGS
jgi:acyl-CoA hydrolase